ncbi:max-binding protein MNT [Astyanax mexicanus]|uniref:Max-binding protein MNT n=2 Tax=Astyanax mexicanus TaxID=7994 RepID=A0A8B9HBN1_ASTMX|nr:max-binding protein MNT [Astyanax mexicanus]KAG9265192.1 max-binding protein MNT isoform X1 [Astyanax mexicanus]
MSIETLLEAAKFLELQAQQQQRAREENELRERLRLEREAEKRRAEVVSCVQPTRTNHTIWAEESTQERHHTPAPAPPPPPPPQALPAPSIPITVIPIPYVSSSPTSLPATPSTPLSPPTTPRLTPPRKATHSPPAQSALHQCAVVPPQVKAAPTPLAQTNGTKPPQLLQPYPGSIVTTSLLPQPAQSSPVSRGSPPDDLRNLDNKKRPGGAGTREVHNKLEKNRRAHLKECFETLKKNIPNVDEKKTSNLSVLRSALRYIQTLKRKEKEYEHEMERLAREKISTQQRLAELKNDLSQWMDVMEVDRVLRQTVQPEDDQVSTSTASEGEDNIDEDMEEESPSAAPVSLPKVPLILQPELRKPQLAQSLTQHLSIPPKSSELHPPAPALQPAPASAPVQPSAPSLSPTPAQAPNGLAALAPQQLQTQVVTAHGLPPAHTHIVSAPSLQPTVITHAAAASHASVIQAVNHVIQAGPKQLAHGPQPIGHITVHPVAHLGQHLPALYPQPVTVAPPTVVSHIAHTLSHSQVNGTSQPSPQAAAMVAKQVPQVVAHHPHLAAQTVLNPVTMVTMPSFPVSTLKLA